MDHTLVKIIKSNNETQVFKYLPTIMNGNQQTI